MFYNKLCFHYILDDAFVHILKLIINNQLPQYEGCNLYCMCPVLVYNLFICFEKL